MPTSSQDKFSAAAKKALIDHRLTVTALAQELGWARNTVSIAIHHPTMFPAVRKAVAKRLKLVLA